MAKEEPKRLYRSRQDKVIAGVCGGIAEYFGIDPVWIRLIAVLLVLADGIGLILYIIAWILMPENPSQKKSKTTTAEKAVERVKRKDKGGGHIILGIILVTLGVGLFLKKMFTRFTFHYIWPLGVIAVGIYLLARRSE